MPIFFNVVDVRNQLLTYGNVYTLRHKRRDGRDVAVMGTRYSFTVFADVMIEEVKPIYASWELVPYVKFSGLKSAEQWLQLAKSFYTKDTQLYLYRVTLIRRRMYY